MSEEMSKLNRRKIMSEEMSEEICHNGWYIYFHSRQQSIETPFFYEKR